MADPEIDRGGGANLFTIIYSLQLAFYALAGSGKIWKNLRLQVVYSTTYLGPNEVVLFCFFGPLTGGGVQAPDGSLSRSTTANQDRIESRRRFWLYTLCLTGKRDFVTQGSVSPANIKHFYNFCTTSAQRLRRWSTIVQSYTNVWC